MTEADLKKWSKNDLVREVLKLREVLADLARRSGIGDSVTVQGLCRRDGKPFVQFDSGEFSWQADPATARMHALITMDAASEAERDASLVAFLNESGMADAAPHFLAMVREHRGNWLDGFRDAVNNRTTTEEGE